MTRELSLMFYGGKSKRECSVKSSGGGPWRRRWISRRRNPLFEKL